MTKKSEESQLAGKKMESGQEKARGHEKVTLAEMRFARTKRPYLMSCVVCEVSKTVNSCSTPSCTVNTY